MREKLLKLQAQVEQNLLNGILPFWIEHAPDKVFGGFYGKIDDMLQADGEYPRCVVLIARILWTFSHAYELYLRKDYATVAHRAYNYLKDNFWDNVYGGAYWAVDHKGVVLEPEKRTYGEAFFIYSMAEYARVFSNHAALNFAMKTFELMNMHAAYENGGYADSLSRDWKKDRWVYRWLMNPNGNPKLLNSHLHLFEATISLYNASGNPNVLEKLRSFLVFLLDTGMDHDLGHMKAGMDIDGKRTDHEISFGHDAECSYLITEAARLIGDPDLTKRADAAALRMMELCLRDGLDTVNGGVFQELDASSGRLIRSKVWWTQCEALTGFFNAYQLSGNEAFADACVKVWNYIDAHMIDHDRGEWFCVGSHDAVDVELAASDLRMWNDCGHDKANKMKCPYHNGRACMEIISRIRSLFA